MELFEAIYGRRSIRRFSGRNIPAEIMQKILDAARWAPSACNRQLWEFVIVTDPELKVKIAEEACFGQRYIKNAPVLVVTFYDDTKERHHEIGPSKHDSIQSAAAAIQNMHLAAYSFGIGTLWIASIKHMLKLNEILGVPKEIRPIAITAMGYSEENVAPPPRRPLDSMVHYNKFSRNKLVCPNLKDAKNWTLEELSLFRSTLCWYGGTISPDRTLERYNMNSKVYREIMKWVVESSKSKKKILDIMPFGGGFLIGLLQEFKKSKDIFAFELSEGNIKFIRQNIEAFGLDQPNYLLSPDGSLAIPHENFDLITCFFRLEQVPSPEVLLGEIYKALKKGGRCILTTEVKDLAIFYGLTLRSRDINIHENARWEIGPFRPLTKRKLNKILNNSSFKIIKQVKLQEDGVFKSLAKQILRDKGVTILTVLEK